MDLFCMHGIKSELQCGLCRTESRTAVRRLLVDDDTIDVRVKSDCSDWWVWDLVSPVIVESYVEPGDTEELIVRPLSPEVLPSSTIMFVDGDRVLPGVVAEGTCYVKTTSMRVGVFPAELYFGFEDKRLIGRYSLYINGKRRKHNERAIGTIQRVRVRDESDVVFEMTDTSLETKCFVRVRVSE